MRAEAMGKNTGVKAERGVSGEEELLPRKATRMLQANCSANASLQVAIDLRG
jgi:hypothetical protein